MDDLAPRLLLEQGRGEQADDVVALDEAAVLVEQEAAIEIAVPGHAEVRAMRLDRIGRGRAHLGQQWVRDAVREIAIGLVMHLDERERQALLDRIDDHAGDAVAGVDDDLERLELGHVDVAEQVPDVAFAIAHFRDDGFALWAFRGRGGDGFFDLAQAGVARDRDRSAAHELHAVVVHRVVARGDFDAAVDAGLLRGPVDFLGAAEADVEHFDAARVEAVRERLQQRQRGMADVAAECDLFGAKRSA